MHYQLFIPGGKAQDPQMLIDLGLGDFVAGADFLSNQEGPKDLDGKPQMGAFIAWQKPGKAGIGHQPQRQTWIPAVPNGPEGEGRGRYWVGFWNDSPVTPEDLQRPYSHPGKSVELGDGNSWRFPIIGELPKDFILADDGSWRFELQRQYHDLYLRAIDLSEEIVREKKISKSWGDVFTFCSAALSQNYRLVPEAVSHLRLFNTENVATALGVLLELDLR